MSDFNSHLKITLSNDIIRRYFVVNGFDGALTMLGLLSSFIVSGNVDLNIAISACFGAAIALGISGFSSAYVSETAERKKWLNDLKKAMVSGIEESIHEKAAHIVPIYIALVNGLSPLLIAFLIMTPLWLARFNINTFAEPYISSVIIAFIILFGLGAYLGNIGGRFWLLSGIKIVIIGLITMAVILLLGQI